MAAAAVMHFHADLICTLRHDDSLVLELHIKLG